MSELRFKTSSQAICTLSLLTGCRVKIAKPGIWDRVKNWVKDTWTGFKRFDLESSAISYVRYNKKSKVLEVAFKARGTYQYNNVPENVFESLLQSKSKGKYFNHKIKDIFDYKRVAREERRMRIAKQLSKSAWIGKILAKQGIQPDECLNPRQIYQD